MPLEHELISAHLGMAVAAEPFMRMHFELILFVFRYNGARSADYFCGKNVSIDTTRTENLARRWRMPHVLAHVTRARHRLACFFMHVILVECIMSCSGALSLAFCELPISMVLRK